MLFKNRKYAAKKLLEILPHSMLIENWIVMATSYGGIEIAKYIANELHFKYDLLITEKIFSKKNDECELAIITETEEIVMHEELIKSFEINIDKLFDRTKKLYQTNVTDNINFFRENNQIPNLKDKNVLLVDEGLNTGLTMMACIKTAITAGAKSVCVAVPVLPDSIIPTIETIADDIYFIEKIEHFVDIKFYYDILPEIKKEEAKKLLKG